MESSVQAAAQAASQNGNGVVTAEQTREIAQRLGAAMAETGLGFLGLSVAVVSANYALKRFAEAWAQKG